MIALFAWILSAPEPSGLRPLRDARGSAWLLAACEGLQRHVGVRLAGLKPFQCQHEAARERAQAALNSSTFTEATTAGSVATIDDAIFFVLEDDVVEPRAMGLTLREAHVARLVQAGLSSKMIAERLGISPRTVDGHVGAVMRKLRVHSRSDIVL